MNLNVKTILIGLVGFLWILAATVAVAQAADALPSWNDGKAKQSIMAFVEKVTTPGSASGGE